MEHSPCQSPVSDTQDQKSKQESVVFQALMHHTPCDSWPCDILEDSSRRKDQPRVL